MMRRITKAELEVRNEYLDAVTHRLQRELTAEVALTERQSKMISQYERHLNCMTEGCERLAGALDHTVSVMAEQRKRHGNN